VKIRTGFVSNSSSSSFCICGMKVTGTFDRVSLVKKFTGKANEDLLNDMKKISYYAKQDELDELDINDYCCDDFESICFPNNDFNIIYGEGVDGYIIGKTVAQFSDYDVDTSETDAEELLKELQKMRTKLGLEDIPIKIYTGTLCC